MNKEEIALLYGFEDSEAGKIIASLKKIRVGTRVLKSEDCHEKIGFVLGLKGFNKSKAEEPSDIDEEIIIFQGIKGKRLDAVLDKMRGDSCKVPKYKAVVTPFNIHWTVRKLYETMLREHGSFKGRAD